MLKNKLVIKALEYSALNHKGDNRKGSKIPYIVHPFEVAMILKENAFTEEVIAAGLLHDLLEDTAVKKEDIKAEFGEEILNLVIAASEKLAGRENRSWKKRKEHTVNYLKNEANFKVKAIACADKLSNSRSMLRNLDSEDIESFWVKFNAGKEDQRWYYQALINSLESLEGMEMYREFKITVAQIFS
ncbi:HD domain-containing protein [Halanaerobium hydrogeniformans]|uniref:Metal dependent phosphohydrolase n=1 Tax=Halanaerobium hydrogeniformans TaxID=656519 RepID=E4RNS9_HALHG|nr:HD domain-containing protein [Halanaerobium hydrogeniformans]ADQ13757.1 metal dependent phosphohydrolase [Halanaerobium hydrogeniformans]